MKSFFIFLILFCQTSLANNFSYQNGKTKYIIENSKRFLEYKSGRDKITIIKNRCSTFSTNNFWDSLKQQFARVQKNSLMGNDSVVLTLGSQRKNMGPLSSQREFFLNLRSQILTLKYETQRKCKRLPSSEATSNENKDDIDFSNQKPSLMRKCVEIICPSHSNTLASAYEEADQFDLKNDPHYHTQIQNRINKDGMLQAKTYITVRKKLQKWLRKERMLKNKKQAAFINFLFHFKDAPRFHFTKNHTVDDSKSRKLFPKLSDSEYNIKRAAAALYHKAFVRRDHKNFDVLESTDPKLLRLYYPGNNLKHRLKTLLDTKKKLIKKVKSIKDFRSIFSMKEFADAISTKKLEKIIHEGTFTAQDLSSINTDIYTLIFFDLTGEDTPVTQQLHRPLHISKLAADHNIANYFKEKNTEAKYMIEKVFKKNKYRSPTCETAYAHSKTLLPTKKQIKAWKKKEDKLKKKFLKGISKKISANTIKTLKKDWFFVPPVSKYENIANIIKAFKKDFSNNKRYRADLSLLDNEENNSFLFSMLTYGAINDKKESLNNESNGGKEYLSGPQELCQRFISNPVPDRTLTLTGGIEVGPLSVKAQIMGDGIIYHELGHNLSKDLQSSRASKKSKRWYKNTMACIRSMHPKSGKLFQEEDFSDLMQTIVAPEIGNSECILARELNNNSYYTTHSLDSGTKGPHSSSLFRVLHIEHVLKEKLPKVCNDALKKKNEKPIFKNCAHGKKPINL